MKRNDRHRFIFYCLYAFGLPILVTLLVCVVDENPKIHDEHKIGIGVNSCFVNPASVGIYLFAPITFVLSLNILLYAITAYKIYQVQKEISVVKKGESRRHSKVNLDKARYFFTTARYFFIDLDFSLTDFSFIFDCSSWWVWFGLLKWCHTSSRTLSFYTVLQYWTLCKVLESFSCLFGNQKWRKWLGEGNIRKKLPWEMFT